MFRQVDQTLGFMKNLITLLINIGLLPGSLNPNALANVWEVGLTLFAATFLLIGLALCVAFILIMIDGAIETYIGLSTSGICRHIVKGKFLDYLKKRRLKKGDVVAFRFDGIVVPLLVTDHHEHSKVIIAKPLKTCTQEDMKFHYVVVLADAKNSYNYDEIEILDETTIMKVLYEK